MAKCTPRVFIIRHGETEWSLDGRHTSTTELPLTANGERRVRATGRALVGEDRLIVPRNLAKIYVSPRLRAQRTLELLSLGCASPMPWKSSTTSEEKDKEKEEEEEEPTNRTTAPIEVTPAIREWDYGAYEGLTSAQIRAQRKEQGLPEWDIWRDGCPDGESPTDVSARLDALITTIRTQYHAPAIARPRHAAPPHDVLLVAHGHVLRALAARWVGRQVSDNPALLLEAGGVGTLSYEHCCLDEPAILLGGAFVVDVVEKEMERVGEAKV